MAVRKNNIEMLKLLLAKGVDTKKEFYDEEHGTTESILEHALPNNEEAAVILIDERGKSRLDDDALKRMPIFVSNFCLVNAQRALSRRKYENLALLKSNPLIQAIREGEGGQRDFGPPRCDVRGDQLPG